MEPRLTGVDPGGMIFDLLVQSDQSTEFGWDMPTAGGRRCFLTLSAGSNPTPVSQRWTLTLSCYAPQTDGSCDWPQASRMYAECVRRILANRKRWPLIDAERQSGPIRQHDAKLGVDYAYGAILLTATAN